MRAQEPQLEEYGARVEKVAVRVAERVVEKGTPDTRSPGFDPSLGIARSSLEDAAEPLDD